MGRWSALETTLPRIEPPPPLDPSACAAADRPAMATRVTTVVRNTETGGGMARMLFPGGGWSHTETLEGEARLTCCDDETGEEGRRALMLLAGTADRRGQHGLRRPLLDRARGGKPPPTHDRQPVAHAEQLRQIRAHQQHRLALCGATRDCLVDLRPAADADA